MDDPELVKFLKTVDKANFSTKPFVQKIPKPWGYELKFTPNGLPYSGKIEHIEAGKRLSLQIHDYKMESYILISGECNLILEDEKGEMLTISMQKGVGYTVKPGQKHRHHAITDCDVVEAAMAEGGNTYRLDDDYTRPTETEELRKDPSRGWDR
jgi:oxalate decarboxylase/phosphoglucose isomerase-like protein (cupin superfamily)